MRRDRHGGSVAAGLFLFLAAVLALLSGRRFVVMHGEEPIYPSPGLTEKKMLSEYFPPLRDTPGDTEVFVFRGQEKGGRMLLLGGTHPNEPAGFITAVLLLENMTSRRGDVFIIPRANRSGFTHSDPQEGNPQWFTIPTSTGPRPFRLGSRLTNPVHQWPDPAVYVNPAGQKLSGNEARNLNRCFPGKARGSLTERVAFAVMELIRKERLEIGVDLHESAPEYPVINALVFHENSSELAALTLLALQEEGFEIRLEASPLNLRGLSHREWGDHAGIKAVLFETANASHGRLKGRPSSSLVVDGRDKFYTRASRLGWLFVPFGEEGIPLRQRVARHLAAIRALFKSLADLEPDKALELEAVPASGDVEAKGVGAFLHPL